MDQQTINKTKEVEKALIGSIMLNEEIYDNVRIEVKPDDFYDAKHQVILQAIDKLYNESKPIDMISINQVLKEGDVKVTAIDLSDLLATVGSSSNYQYYCDQIKEYSRRRKLTALAQTLEQKAKDGEVDSSTVIREVEATLADMTSTERGTGEVNTAELVDEVIETIKHLKENPRDVVGTTTGIGKLDMKLSGFHKTDLMILAARPGQGKSALALQLARNVAMEGKTPVMFFSLEMGGEQLVQRIVAAEARVSMTKIKSGRVDDMEMESLELASRLIKQLPIYINDKASMTLQDIRSQLKVHNANNEQKIGFVVVDYLQLMETVKRYDSAVYKVAEISRGLKQLAKDFNVPVLALSQFSRDVEKRGGKPKLSDLRDSGSIEQDADIVMFIHSDTEEVDAFGGRMVELIVEKHRNGSTGAIKMNFDAAKMTFLEVDDISEW